MFKLVIGALIVAGVSLLIVAAALAQDLAGHVIEDVCANDGALLRWAAGLLATSVVGSVLANFRNKLPGPVVWLVDLLALNFVKGAEATAAAALKIAPVLLLAALAACAQPGKPLSKEKLHANLETAIYLLHATGCGVSAAGTIAAPIVSMAADEEGNQVLAAIDAGGAVLCRITVPPSALPEPAPANAAPAVALAPAA